MYIPEADVEYLIRTLSEARSRATELAASISSRLGTEHRLAGLANAASSKIEKLLTEIRLAAVQIQPVSLGQEDPPRVHHPISFATQAGLEADHWLPMFMEHLSSQVRAPAGITFEVVERLLQQHKDEFLHDFFVARRMYRNYPHLFPEIFQDVGPQKSRTAA